MGNIEKLTHNEENDDERQHLAKKEAEITSKEQEKEKKEMPKEFGSYEKLVQFAKGKGSETEEMIATRATLEAGTPEHELLQQQIAVNREMLPQVLTKIALADEATKIALLHENDPDFEDTRPTDYRRVEIQND